MAIPVDYDSDPERFRLLPDREAVRDYLVGKGVPRERAALEAASVEVPLRVTKRGALLFARKR